MIDIPNYNVIILAVFVIIATTALYTYYVTRNHYVQKPDGTIFVETTEDGERDRIRFVLDMELDDIRKKKLIVFSVEDKSQMSKN